MSEENKYNGRTMDPLFVILDWEKEPYRSKVLGKDDTQENTEEEFPGNETKKKA